MGCRAVECPFNPGRGCRPAVMTRLAGTASGRGLASELPLPSRQAGLRQHPRARHPPGSGGQSLERERGAQTQPPTPFLGETRWVQPPPPLPQLLLSPFPPASTLLPPRHLPPPSLPPVIHGWYVAVLLHKWAPGRLGDGLRAGRPEGTQSPGGAPHAPSTRRAGPLLGFVPGCVTGPRVCHGRAVATAGRARTQPAALRGRGRLDEPRLGAPGLTGGGG